MLYDIGLRITYLYASPAVAGRQVLRMMPADLPTKQRLVAGHLAIDPPPDERSDGMDFFGNTTVECAYRSPHIQIRFEVHAQVNRIAAIVADKDSSPSLAALAREIVAHRGVGRQAPVHFIGASPHVPTVPAITAYAAISWPQIRLRSARYAPSATPSTTTCGSIRTPPPSTRRLPRRLPPVTVSARTFPT